MLCISLSLQILCPGPRNRVARVIVRCKQPGTHTATDALQNSTRLQPLALLPTPPMRVPASLSL